MATAAAALLILTASADPSVALQCPAPVSDALVYIDVYDGPPANNADLVPDQHQDKANKIAWNTWELYQNPERIYVKCGYGKRLEGPYSRTEFIMLPETAKSCRADFKIGPKPTDLTLQKFSCR
ncbi:MAG: STY0301 family protein [Stellaceae bacterium]